MDVDPSSVPAAAQHDLLDWLPIVMSVLALLISGIVAVFAGRQAKAAKLAYQAQVFTVVSGTMRNRAELYDLILAVAQKDPPPPLGPAGPKLRPFCADINAVAVLAEKGVVHKDWVLGMWGATIGPVWQFCKSEVERWRDDEAQPRLFAHFQKLAEECLNDPPSQG